MPAGITKISFGKGTNEAHKKRMKAGSGLIGPGSVAIGLYIEEKKLEGQYQYPYDSVVCQVDGSVNGKSFSVHVFEQYTIVRSYRSQFEHKEFSDITIDVVNKCITKSKQEINNLYNANRH